MNTTTTINDPRLRVHSPDGEPAPTGLAAVLFDLAKLLDDGRFLRVQLQLGKARVELELDPEALPEGVPVLPAAATPGAAPAGAPVGAEWFSPTEARILAVVDAAAPGGLAGKQIARAIGVDYGAELKHLLQNLVAREVLAHDHTSGYTRTGTPAATPDDPRPPRPSGRLPHGQLAERIATARQAKAATNGHPINLD